MQDETDDKSQPDENFREIEKPDGNWERRHSAYGEEWLDWMSDPGKQIPQLSSIKDEYSRQDFYNAMDVVLKAHHNSFRNTRVRSLAIAALIIISLGPIAFIMFVYYSRGAPLVITQRRGDIELMQGGQLERALPSRRRLILQPGSMVELVRGPTRMKVFGPGSIQYINGGRDKPARLELSRGVLYYYHSGEKVSKMYISGRTIFIRPIGTAFRLSVERDGESLAVSAGRVRVRKIGEDFMALNHETLELKAGQGLDVSQGTLKLPEIRKASEEELRALNHRRIQGVQVIENYD